MTQPFSEPIIDRGGESIVFTVDPDTDYRLWAYVDSDDGASVPFEFDFPANAGSDQRLLRIKLYIETINELEKARESVRFLEERVGLLKDELEPITVFEFMEAIKIE